MTKYHNPAKPGKVFDTEEEALAVKPTPATKPIKPATVKE